MEKHRPLEGISGGLRRGWLNQLNRISRLPLLYCPDFAVIADRWEKWWRFESHRPLLIARARKRHDLRWDKAFDLLHRPGEWLQVRLKQLENTHHVGEAVPFIRADIGPVAMGAFLGAPLRISHTDQTAWQEPIISDWASSLNLRMNLDNSWLGLVLDLVNALIQDCRGRYLVCLPDLTGAVDTLANLRGQARLCLDLLENRDAVKRAAMNLVDVWERVFTAMHDLALGAGCGVVQWLGCWSIDSVYTLPTCDFNALIGPEDFKEVCLPSLTEQARRAGRCVFHLDGPDAARHADALAAESAITALQYTPGVGTPSAVLKMEMLKRIQRSGKPVYVVCPKDEVERISGELDPRGLVIAPMHVDTPSEADSLLKIILRQHR